MRILNLVILFFLWSDQINLYNRVIPVCLLRLICRDLTCVSSTCILNTALMPHVFDVFVFNSHSLPYSLSR
jgi:hypothetical protein